MEDQQSDECWGDSLLSSSWCIVTLPVFTLSAEGRPPCSSHNKPPSLLPKDSLSSLKKTPNNKKQFVLPGLACNLVFNYLWPNVPLMSDCFWIYFRCTVWIPCLIRTASTHSHVWGKNMQLMKSKCISDTSNVLKCQHLKYFWRMCPLTC